MKRSLFSGIVGWLVVMVFAMVPQTAKASPSARCNNTWDANAGAETKDQGVQADAFLPNEVWILSGDCIEWTFAPKNEVHTVTFLNQSTNPEQVRPSAPPPVGPPAGPGSFAASGCVASADTPATPVTYDGGECISSNPVAAQAKYTVYFNTPGNYKLVCLVHTDMNGTVHVLPSTSQAPYNKFVYERRAEEEAQALLSDDDHQRRDDDRGWDTRRDDDHSVIAGIGEIVATGGGLQYRAVVRFLPEAIHIHAGESVVWTNLDPTEPHTITFGAEPPGPAPPFIPTLGYNLGAPGADGTLTATTNCATKSVCDTDYKFQDLATYVSSAFINSGFVVAAAPDRTGSAQLPVGTTRIRITFPTKGTYYYHCALHDVDGMNGTVIVE